MTKVTKMIYSNGVVKITLCLDKEQCYKATYEVLSEEFEKRLATLVGEAGAEGLITYTGGDLPEEERED